MNGDTAHNRSRAPNNIAGFTLLEALVATSIIAIGLATAVSSLATYQRDQRLSRAALSLRLLVERTYSHALATRQEMHVVIEPTVARVVTSAGTEQERLLFKAPLAPELRDNHPQEVHLYPSLSASPATVTLRLGTSTCAVIISLRGRVRAQCA